MHRFELTGIPYGRQSISEEDIAAVCVTLRSDFLTCGPKVEEFEEKFAALVGAKHAVAVSSATAALHLAMAALKVKAGDRVVTSPNTFVASANCAAYVGATPDFSDIDPIAHNLDPDVLAKTWKSDTKAIVAVDYAGQPADMSRLSEIAREHGSFVIEDASHGVGSRFFHENKVHQVGSHPWADITVFSFHPVKTLTTAEGGMLVTENDEWGAAAKKLRAHGIEREKFLGLGVPGDAELSERGPWYHEMQGLGFNYRITDLQCALGLSQLSRLESFVQRRQEIVATYNDAFSDLKWLKAPNLTNQANKNLISWHLYTVEIDFPSLKKTRTHVMTELRARGVGSQVLYIPVYLQPWYRQTYKYAAGKCPIAENYYRRALSLPLFPAMTNDDVQQVIEAVRAQHA